MQREQLIENCFNGNVALQKMWRKSMWNGLTKTELSPTQLTMLFLVDHHQPVMSKDLATHMRISRSAVTQLIDVLHKHSYIERATDPEDRRNTYITLSPSGKKKLQVIHKERKALFIASTETLTDEELIIMTAIQNKMINQLEG